ncbi:MAG: type III pantothenate kinase, partial [Pseudomonadota bacterium]
KRTADEYAVWLTQLMSLISIEPKDIGSAIIATVVPEARFNLVTMCEKYFGCEPMMIGDPALDLGVSIRISRPEQVGADRLVNTVAAHERYGKALIIIDFGTATTFDVIDEDGGFCGNVIAPGIHLSMDALSMASALLPRVDVRKTDEVIGKATVPAMQSGVFWGYIAMIDGLVARIREEYGQPLLVVATGGLAPLFAETSPSIDHVYSNMTIRGLELIHRRNSER